LLAPGGAQALSNWLNGLRLAGLVWAAVALWHGGLWVGLALLLYFFVAGELILRLTPQHYLARGAAKGNAVAIEHLQLIATVRAKRERFYAQDADEAPIRRQHKSSSCKTSGPAGTTREHADWLFAQALRTGKAFLQYAERAGLVLPQPSPILAMTIRPDVEALLLGYGLVSMAYRGQYKDPAADVLRVLRVAMAGMFLTQAKDIGRHIARTAAHATGRTVNDSMPLEVRKAAFTLANTRLKAVDDAVTLALDRLHAGSPSPLASFYEQLVPAFGGPASAEEYERRYGPILQDLYASLWQSIREFMPASAR
jgi:hypothetical protein